VYQLEAEGDGKSFETTRVTAEVSAFGGAPQTFTQNVALRPIKGKPVPPAELVSAETVDPALPRQARDAFKKGARLADDNKPEDAIKQFKQAVAAAPDFYLAHLTLGDQYLKLRKFDESLTAYEKARELRPQRAEPISGIGAVLIQLQKYADALPLLRQVIQMGGQTAVTYLYAGLAETMTSEYEAAETDLKRALELNKSPVARVYLANLYELKGDPQSAIDQLKAFLNENPNAPQVQQVREAVEKLRKKIQKKQR
jgi:tetratricopeptide (TPR) repeat protein